MVSIAGYTMSVVYSYGRGFRRWHNQRSSQAYAYSSEGVGHMVELPVISVTSGRTSERRHDARRTNL